VPSASLIPVQDSSVLFTVAGMQQFKKYFLGNAAIAKKDYGNQRLTSAQKCFRVADIDQIGDDTHCTFFEMLGNFSIGDYFKTDAIALAWEFVTKELKLSPDRLLVTYFRGERRLGLRADIKSKNTWRNLGVKKERIVPTGMEETFWGPPGATGPCGPSTEIHFYRKSEKIPEGVTVTTNPMDFVEIWNIVFMEFEKNTSGEFHELEQKNIDTGMGFERVAAVCEKVPTLFDTTLFRPIINAISSDTAFDKNVPDAKKRIRVVADHLRSSIFLVSENVAFGKKEQQAVLRRIFRKALSQYHQPNANLESVLDAVAETYKDTYPDIKANKKAILQKLKDEQILFHNARERRVEQFVNKIRHQPFLASQSEALQGPSERVLTAEEAFQLHATHGFSYEQLHAEGYAFDQSAVDSKLQEHKEKSKAGAEKKFGGHGLGSIASGVVPEGEKQLITRLHTATHLLHTALRTILGNEVHQEGSDITPERLRFDFTFPRKMSDDEKGQVESFVNGIINKSCSVIREEMRLNDALKSGALAFFREKYPDTVSVYSVIDPETGAAISKELCGGPHVQNTSEIGAFHIQSEKSVAQGIRRIKATIESA